MKDYKIIRINQTEKTVTVLLQIDGRTLQEDVAVKDFMDMPTIEGAIEKRLVKFQEDLDVAKKLVDAPVHPDLQALVDKHTKSFTETN